MFAKQAYCVNVSKKFVFFDISQNHVEAMNISNQSTERAVLPETQLQP